MSASPITGTKDGGTAFVILHYMSDSLTQDCIDSILKFNDGQDSPEARCVVVDNASGNGSLERLLERYGENNPAVHFIANPDNLGFSCANNIGYRYARDTWDPDFIIVANNDIQVTQTDFLDVLGEVYREKRPYLIGPDIYCERLGFHQSPMNRFPSIDMARDLLDGYMNPSSNCSPRDVLKHLGYATPGVRSLLAKRSLRKNLELQRSFEDWKDERSDRMTLQGACLIFTRGFIETGEDPFSPETFLYEEENILAWRFAKNGWPVLYTPRLQVIHYNDGATDIVLKDRQAKEAFLKKNEISSLGVLIDYMNGK